MNKTLSFILIVAVAAMAGYAGAKASGTGRESVTAPKQETAFERIMRTRTLRCAYISRLNHYAVDASTKKTSGIDYEVMEAAAGLLHLKIDWVEETGYGSYPEQLNRGKEDALCTTVWSGSALAHRILYTAPIMHSQLYAYVRDGDTRFDNNVEALNNEKFTLTVIDGSSLKAATDAVFPKARQIAASQLSDDAPLMLDVVTRKADAGLFLVDIANNFNRYNPDKKLHRVTGAAPVRTYAEVFAVAMGEFELREMLNVALNELHNNGEVERILRKYESTPGEIARVAKP